MSGLWHTTTRAFSQGGIFGGPRNPEAPPAPPNPNDAANASQATTDAMRARRGILANIYAGAQNTPPVTGKTTLGT